MVCQFLLYYKVNQLYIDIHPRISSLLRLPPTLPIPPLQVGTKHRADLPVPCGCFPLAIYFTSGSVYMSMPLSLCPSFPFPTTRVLKSILYVYVFIPALPLGSSVPSFFFFFIIFLNVLQCVWSILAMRWKPSYLFVATVCCGLFGHQHNTNFTMVTGQLFFYSTLNI